MILYKMTRDGTPYHRWYSMIWEVLKGPPPRVNFKNVVWQLFFKLWPPTNKARVCNKALKSQQTSFPNRPLPWTLNFLSDDTPCPQTFRASWQRLAELGARIWDLRRGLFHRGWFQNTIFYSKQHGKQHCCTTDTTCNNIFVETTSFETTPYASPDACWSRSVGALLVRKKPWTFELRASKWGGFAGEKAVDILNNQRFSHQ